MDARTIAPEIFTTNIPEGMDILLVNILALAQNPPIAQRGHIPNSPSVLNRLNQLRLYLTEAQTEK
jgi:hypothetical protein